MLLFAITATILVGKVLGHYCDSRECPGFSLIKAVNIESVSAESLEITWIPKENYTIEKYEVHWYSTYNCDKCTGQISLVNITSLKLNVQACKTYFFEVYAFEENSTVTAPGLISQITVADPLQQGTAVRVSGKWAILRWVLVCDCPNSIFLAVCFGPNIITQTKTYHPDRVVIFNVSVLQENSTYVCVSYTVNAAGSSLPSWPIIFTTVQESLEENIGNGGIECRFSIILLIIGLLVLLIGFFIYFTKRQVLKLPWRRSYDVTQTRI
ncbi:unnamed protein product [Nezara viridula]|uniref:Fibronectin type-III domain-containing protein n=1 Tax=Nezara viridula TaxID=85310 RepID=A0A9P0E8Y4_NEZVI|nr:unnamed protein product [Nezara viridula]